MAWASRPSVLASGTFPSRIRVNSRYRRFVRTSRSRLEAPGADVLEQQQPQDDLGRKAQAAARAALRPALPQGRIDGRHQVVVVEDPVDRPHPVVPELVDGLTEKSLGKTALTPADLNHARSSGRRPVAAPASTVAGSVRR